MAVGSLLHATLVSLQYCYQVYRELVELNISWVLLMGYMSLYLR